MISAISVKDRLKNRAAASGKTFQEVLTAYGLERTVYRLSVSEYMEMWYGKRADVVAVLVTSRKNTHL